ncbi:MAG TPA: DUF3500 domain-containing protein [Longimicrobiaceae bacterium]|nr:DUF3500 domain-containing protein [Longimicrobiaceae bacterium]
MMGSSVRALARSGPLAAVVAALSVASGAQIHAQQGDPLAEPFRGITTDGTVVQGLFPIRATGVSTEAVVRGAEAFLASLSEEQSARTRFAVDADEWRRWNNIHRAARSGLSFSEMSEAQRERAFAMIASGLSARGMEKTRDIMRLNHHAAELVNNFEEYGEFLYSVAVMGEPSATQPWGWQLEGHHLIINYFVLGDQVVMTPTFMGSEPVIARSGRYEGTAVLQEEQDKGLALMQSLRPDQRAQAAIADAKTGNNALTQAYRDNVVLDFQGLRVSSMDAGQRAALIEVIAEYVHNLPEGHARVRMEEVERYLDETYFAWIGEVGPEATFYYRIHSPVILIEFDHQLPVALGGPRVPLRAHIHTVVRTPNGNDYGADLLRQHHEDHADDPGHGHVH